MQAREPDPNPSRRMAAIVIGWCRIRRAVLVRGGSARLDRDCHAVDRIGAHCEQGRAATAMWEGGAGSATRCWSAADQPGSVPDLNRGTCSRTRRAAAGSPQLHVGAYARHLRLPCAAGASTTYYACYVNYAHVFKNILLYYRNEHVIM